ncbi:uncharacterized protein LOC133199711 [Saccostrea echinata]|uniref:uncharacterized protein LOC133199711 n=1 Tax=Saccostrea echinata TaxID=191078 RepID=UPI002A83E82A|nr:uncharacterized protein LOC133199711 [Saccostrea echinata]
MYACIFFIEDASLSVVGKNNKSLKVLNGEWEPKGKVEMLWPGKNAGQKSLFHGTIIKVGDEETLNKFATQAYSKILKRAKNITEVPEELFSFEVNETEEQNEKRSRSKTQRLRESEEQDDTMSPKKKKKKVNVQSKNVTEDAGSPKKKNKKTENTEPKTKNPKLKHPDTLPQSLKTLQRQKGMHLLNQFENVSADQTRMVSETDAVSSETISISQTWQICNDAMDAVGPSTQHTPLKVPFSPERYCEIPVPSLEVIQAIENFLRPDVQSYLKKIVTYARQQKPQNTFADLDTVVQADWMTDNRTKGQPTVNFTAPYRETLDSQTKQPSTVDVDFTAPYRENLDSQTKQSSTVDVDFTAPYRENLDSQKKQSSTVDVDFTAPYRENLDSQTKQSSIVDVDFTAPYRENLDSQTKQSSTVDVDFTAPYRETFDMPLSNVHVNAPYQRTNQFLDLPHSTTHRPREPTPHHIYQNIYHTETVFGNTLTPASPSPPPQQTSVPPISESTPTNTPPPLRRSPRKQKKNEGIQKVHVFNILFSCLNSQCKLLDGCDLEIDSDSLRIATSAARTAKKPGFTLCYKLLPEIFSLEVLANSRGQGLSKTKEGDFRKPLDKELVSSLKNYVTVWCRKNGMAQPTESLLNDAITERISYARKQLKPKVKKNAPSK